MSSGMVSEFKVCGHLPVGDKPASVTLTLDGVEHHLDIDTVRSMVRTLNGAMDSIDRIQKARSGVNKTEEDVLRAAAEALMKHYERILKDE